MTGLEAAVHKYLSRIPILKRAARNAYQYLFQARGSETTAGLPALDMVINHAFFGFHDFSPWSYSGKYLCFHRHLDSQRRKIHSDTAPVGIHLYDYDIGCDLRVGESKSFNWQMGARLQWLGQEDKLLWNTVLDNALISNIFCPVTSRTVKTEWSTYAVSNLGKLSATCNFSNIERNMKGYGYVGSFKEATSPDEVNIVDRQSDALSDTINKADFGISQSDAGFFSHLQFSPCDCLLALFYRQPSKFNEYATSLMVYDLVGRRVLYRLTDFKIVTHFCWLDKLTLLFFGERNGRRCYYTLNCISGDVHVFAPLFGFPDGHPQHCKGMIITDTYPDRRRLQGLYSVRLSSQIVKKIGEFYSPMRFRDYSRVDLHPRFSRDGYYYAVDHVSEGVPSIGIGSLNDHNK